MSDKYYFNLYLGPKITHAYLIVPGLLTKLIFYLDGLRRLICSVWYEILVLFLGRFCVKYVCSVGSGRQVLGCWNLLDW